MLCKNCGREIDADSKFCSYCGVNAQQISNEQDRITPLNSIVKKDEESNVQSDTETKKSFRHMKLFAVGVVGALALMMLFVLVSNREQNERTLGESNLPDSEYSHTTDKALEFLKTKDIICESDGTVIYSIEYVYDTECRLITEKRYDGSNNYVFDTATYIYDENGKILESTQSPFGTIDERIIYDYDLSGVLHTKTEYGSNGNISSITEYVMENPVKSSKYRENGELWWWHEYLYDASGRLIEDTEYNKDGEPNMQRTYAYDMYGNLTLNRLEKSKSDPTWTEYEYSEDGLLVSETNYKGNTIVNIVNKTEYMYDSNSNPVEVIEYNGNGELYRRAERVLDEKGNIIAINIYGHNGELSQTEEILYDEHGNIVMDKYSGDGLHNFGYWKEYFYDEYGNQIKCISYYDDGSVDDWYEYEYQSKNRVNPKFCVNSIWGANRAKFIQGGSRGIRLLPC